MRLSMILLLCTIVLAAAVQQLTGVIPQVHAPIPGAHGDLQATITIQVSDSSRSSRVIMASDRPMIRALSR